MTRSQLTDISPARAEEILSNNSHNRGISPSIVKRYSREMKAGEWRWDNGVPIVIAADGTLLDGQHRLNAIVHSGVTARGVSLNEGAPRDVFSTFDNGKPRDMADAASIVVRGKISMKRIKIVTATAKTLMNNSAGDALSQRPNAPTVAGLMREAEAIGWDALTLSAHYEVHEHRIKKLKQKYAIPERVGLFMCFVGAKPFNNAVMEDLDFMLFPDAFEPVNGEATLISDALSAAIMKVKSDPHAARGVTRAVEALAFTYFRVLLDVATVRQPGFTTTRGLNKRLAKLLKGVENKRYSVAFPLVSE